MSYNSIVRMHEFWDAMKALLSGSASLNAVLGGPNRVYRVTEDFDRPEDPRDTVPWGRLVIVPSDTLWPVPDMPGQTKTASWLLRTEFNDFKASGYSVDVSMDAALSLADSLMVGWLPGGFAHVLVAVPVYRYNSPRSLPQWNDATGVWWKSVEYRTEVSPL